MLKQKDKRLYSVSFLLFAVFQYATVHFALSKILSNPTKKVLRSTGKSKIMVWFCPSLF